MNEHQSHEGSEKSTDHMDPFQKKMFEAIRFAGNHKKPLIIAGCVLLAVVLIISGILYTIQNSERKASALLAGSLESYRAEGSGSGGYEAALEGFTRLLNEYPNTKAGKIGKFRFAGICYEATKYDRAYDLYTEVLDDFKNDPVMGSLAYNALGRTCLALEKFDQAEKSFRKAAKMEKSVMKDEAVFSLGMISEKDGSGESYDFYKDVVENHPQSIYQPIARSKTETFQ